MHNENRFIHTRTGEVVELTGTDAEMSKIVTITATGRRVRPRTVKTSSLKTGYSTKTGTPWKSAYVAVSCLPEGHAMAPLDEAPSAAQDVPSTPEFVFDMPDFSKMSEAELSAYGNARKTEAARADDLHEKAKDELKSRTRNPGMRIFGDIAVVAKRNRRFSGKKAKSLLSTVQYAAICVTKPDSAKARTLLNEDSPLYKSLLDDHGWTMEIRTATESDRQNLAEKDELAAAKTEMDLESLFPEHADSPF